MANGDKNGVTGTTPVTSSVAPPGTKKRKGRKPDPSVPQVPSTVYPNASVAMGQQPDNEKAQLYCFTYVRKHEGKEVKASLYTWALSTSGANSNFLKTFQPGSETNAVSPKEQLKLLKRNIAKEKGENVKGENVKGENVEQQETKQPASV